MKPFFITLGIGLVAVAGGLVAVSYGPAGMKVAIARLHLPDISSLAAAVMAAPGDGTSILGMSRTVRYSALEEEDLISSAVSYPAVEQPLSADAYVITDLATNKVYAGNDADRLMPIASLTKLVTAVVVSKLIPHDARIAMNATILGNYGNTSEFTVGETFLSQDLLYPLLMVSSNEAAEAYARFYGRASFIAAMNEFTQSIGAYRTRFEDPSGLSPRNVSTANDMALILNWIRQNEPSIIAITKLKTKTVRTHSWTNPAHFLNWSNYLGGKNGYTDEALRTSAVLFAMGPHKDPYAVIILGSNARDADVVKLLAKVK